VGTTNKGPEAVRTYVPTVEKKPSNARGKEKGGRKRKGQRKEAKNW